MENYRDETHNITKLSKAYEKHNFVEQFFMMMEIISDSFGNHRETQHTHFWNQILHQSGFNDRVRGEMNHWNS